jgi:hypothetical protein
VQRLRSDAKNRSNSGFLQRSASRQAKRMQHRPDTDADTVDTADGIKRASAHAARVYRQKCRQIELEETRKGTVKMELEPFLFNDL